VFVEENATFQSRRRRNLGALRAPGGAASPPIDPEQRVIIDAWTALPETVKVNVLAMVQAANRPE
jgi:hypothetical protein